MKKALFLEKLGKIIAFSLLVSAPYFIISLPLNIEIVKGFYTGTKDASKGVYAATNQGVSIYSATPDPYGSNPISIVKNDPIILIISLLLMSSFRLFKKKEYLLILMIFPIYLLVSSNGPFSQRILYYLFLVYFLLFSSIIDNKKWVYIILTALLVFGVNYIGEKKPRMGGLNPEIYLQYLRNFDKEETLFITNGSQGVLIDELGWRTVPEEDLSLVSFKQDNRTIKNMLPFDIFYATGHKYPPTIENDGRTKSIYVIIPQGMIGKNTPGGEIKLENWNNSKYFQKVPDTPCSYGTGKIFCYMYKLNYLSINH